MSTAEENLTTKWGYIPVNITQQNGTALLEQGETYSMMFPYCTGCWEGNEHEGYHRDDWDYWSGKFIIFESTVGPHTIQGSDYLLATGGIWGFTTNLNNDEAKLMGNSTFASMTTKDTKVYRYSADPMWEAYTPNLSGKSISIDPTVSFLYGNLGKNGVLPLIRRSGQVIYGDNTPTGNIPTVGGGNDLFITDIVGGVNIAVAEPQHVRVMSATGVLLFNGMVQTSVDVALPTTGVYVITGENEVHKILH